MEYCFLSVRMNKRDNADIVKGVIIYPKAPIPQMIQVTHNIILIINLILIQVRYKEKESLIKISLFPQEVHDTCRNQHTHIFL